MPFLIRIILQRALIVIYSFLAFLGISPEAQIPNPDRANEIIEERREAFSEILETESKKENITNDAKDAEYDANGDTDKKQPETNIEKIIKAVSDAKEKADEIKEGLEKSTPDNITDSVKSAVADQKPSVTSPVQGVTKIVAGDSSNSIRNVVLNSICVRREGNVVSVSTGSGVLVSSEGVVLTNAHVAQFFVIQDYDNDIMDCSLYRENIPTFGYKAEVIYASPDWISSNYKLISALNAVGTGEEDYAFLRITKNTNPALPLPQSFPHAEIDVNYEAEANDPVIAAGYPGAPSSLIEISSAGVLKIDPIEIDDVFTFGGGNVDIITTDNTFVGAKGASGGGVFKGDDVSGDAVLVGTITTTQGTTGNAQINAITPAYINRDLLKDTGEGIDQYLSGSLSSKVIGFRTVYLNNLAKLLIDQL